MKRSEVSKNLIIDFITSLFVLKRESFNPCSKIFKSFLWDKFFKVRVKVVTQEIMECCFWFKTTTVHMIYCSYKVVPEFMVIQTTKMAFVASFFKACICFCLFFLQLIDLQELWNMLFISSKKLFLLSKYSNFVFFPVHFHTFEI